MTIAATISANEILNRVAAEVGIQPVPDPYGSTDPAFVKMQYLLTTAGEELVTAYPWEFLIAEFQVVTASGDTGDYALPSDFGYMINQTGWERGQNVPLGGPLSPQDWTYLKGRDLAQNTLYASFRIAQGKFNIYPNPVPIGLDINFEYISLNWVYPPGSSVGQVKVLLGSDIPVFDKTLITRYVKLKYLEATGFDTTKAQDDFAQSFSFITGHDKSAPVINAGRSTRVYPYLSYYNLPDTGYGL